LLCQAVAPLLHVQEAELGGEVASEGQAVQTSELPKPLKLPYELAVQ